MHRRARNGIVAAIVAAAAMGLPGRIAAQEATKLEPIVVTATRIEQKVSEQASAVSVVTREDIEMKSPAVAGDVLQGIPGLDVQRTGSAGNRENIKIRGGAATHTLVMIDGFPVNSPTLGSFDIGSLPVDDFEQVEIVRGAQSALYGSNAMGGVVNFLPRKGEEGRQYGVGLAAGSFSSLKWNGFAQGAGKRGNLHLGAGGWESDGILPNDETSLKSFLGSGEAAVGDRSRLHALLFTTDQQKEIPIDFGTLRDVNHHLTRRSFMAGARWETDVSRALTVTASGSVFDEFFHEKDPADPSDAFPFVFDDTTKTRKMDFRLQGRYVAGKVSTTFVGVEYVKDRATDALRSNFGDTDLAASTYNRSIYLQEELRFQRHTGLSLGARLDRNSEAGTEFNPKVAVFHEIERIGTRVRGAVGRGFRVPTISEKADPFIGNRDLAPEIAVSYEAGADFHLLKAAQVSATWFYQDFKDLIQFDSSVPGPVGFGQLRNIGRAFSRGVEAEASYRFLPQAALAVTYTWSNTWDPSNQRRILGIPTQRGELSVLLNPAPRWEGRIDWRIESDQLDAPPNGGDIRRPGYARVDVFAKYRWQVLNAEVREIALTGKIQNLLDREYEERKGFPAPGFNFLLGAEVKI
ncbi:MAG: TonB-dependent receptor [Deltaproteobacteria bacterium]|nr:TonB-dependent receptor [Deltaproteobacteria bacterium]